MDQRLHNYMRPGIVLCVAYPEAAMDGEALLRGIESVASDLFFASVEVRYVPEASARRRMVEILRASHLDVVYETYPRFRQLGLDLNSGDNTARARAVEEGRRAIDEAVEIDAVRINIASGPDPGPDGRDAGTDALVDSLCTLGEYAAGLKGPPLALEPFPRDSPDPYLIGPTAEAIALVRLVREVYPDFGLTLDTAHMALQREDVAATLAIAAPYLGQMHLANVAPGDPTVAPPLGIPGGVYDAAHLSDTLLALFRIGFLGAGHRPLVLLRVSPHTGDNPAWVIAGAKRVLLDAWARL